MKEFMSTLLKRRDLVGGGDFEFVRLEDYGVERRGRGFNGDVEVMSVDVFVSGEHVVGRQDLPVERVYFRDGEVAGKTSWFYVVDDSDVIFLKRLHSVSFFGGQELHQELNYLYRGDGSLSGEELFVDGVLYKRRTYSTGFFDTGMMYDDEFDSFGNVYRRVVFVRSGDAWERHSYEFVNGVEKVIGVEVVLGGPLDLVGVPHLNSCVDAPNSACVLC